MGQLRHLVVALAACGADGPGVDPGSGEPVELVGITAAHNAERSAVGVPPATWNDDLAALATGFIADCEFAHSSTSERSDTAGFEYIGENLFSSSGFQPTGAEVAGSWAAEKVDYDHDSNTCAAVCGHYTQIVWRESTALGCAIQGCGNGFIVSCEYGPGGNINGQRPY